MMEEINELISKYGLKEDGEHIIIPFTDKTGRNKLCFLLKRRYMRIAYSETYHVDYPLEEIIEATVKYPELPLTESLYLLQNEGDKEQTGSLAEDKNNGERQAH